jgi:hypothetical protein
LYIIDVNFLILYLVLKTNKKNYLGKKFRPYLSKKIKIKAILALRKENVSNKVS